MSSARANEIFRSDLSKIELRTDRMFFWLLIGQWIGAIIIALVWSPRTWIGEYWSIHQHVLAATLLGGLFAAYPLLLILRQPGTRYTRHMIAIGQMLQSALLVHVTGGRIETHFHVFGSLALLSFYRDWPVLITGSAVVYIDHLVLGALFPLSVYGVPAATYWRSLEHAFWVIFEDIFLIMSCRKGLEELRTIAERQVKVEEMAVALRSANETLEDKVKARTGEMEEANRGLAEYTTRVEATNKELDDFTYTVSHDLKEPLRSIDAFSKFIAEDCGERLSQEGRDYLERVRANALRMQQLIEDLLTVSRLTRNANHFQSVRIKELIEDRVKPRFEYIMKEKSVELVLKEGLPTLMADRVRMAELFANLISNAIKYSDKPRCRIEVDCRRVNGDYRFSVSDNGPGIDARYFDKIFLIFQRLGKREDHEGTGVGLTIVKKIVELHKGKIWVESELGKGTTFHFTIPPHLQPDEAHAANGQRATGEADLRPADMMRRQDGLVSGLQRNAEAEARSRPPR